MVSKLFNPPTKIEDEEERDVAGESPNVESPKGEQHDAQGASENPEDAFEEETDQIFPNMATKTDWTFNEMIRVPNRREALIQFVGNETQL